MHVSIERHWRNVRLLGCIVTGDPAATIHHIHGGSVIEELDYRWHRGGSQKTNDYLVIPLQVEIHTGTWGIDAGMGKIKSVEEWEAKFGRQMDLLRKVQDQLGYDVMELARAVQSGKAVRG